MVRWCPPKYARLSIALLRPGVRFPAPPPADPPGPDRQHAPRVRRPHGGVVHPRAARSSANRDGMVRYQTHRPRLSPTIRPASVSTLRWWETVGWERPMGSTRSQTQTSPSAAEASSERMRRRAGSARAAKPLASSAASVSSSGAAPMGGQQMVGSASVATDLRAMIELHPLTNVDLSAYL